MGTLVENTFSFLIRGNAYILQAFIVVFVALVIDLLQRKFLKRLLVRAKKTKTQWDDIFVSALPQPLSLIIWVSGIYLASEIIQKTTGAVIFDAMEPLRDASIIGAFGWFLVRIINRCERDFLDKTGYDKTTVNAVSKLLRVSIIITAVLVALQTLGFSISGVLAFGGIGGIAVGFAAKDLLANFFGGLMIYLDRPFAVGDWIRSPDREIEGTVEHIGWRITRIRTFDKRPLYVPNLVFSSIAVENPQRMENRRIYETIGIRYEDASKMDALIRRVKEMLLHHPEIDPGKTLIVNFNSFAPSSLDFFVYTFTKTTDWVYFHEVKQNVLLKILKIVEDEGAEVAFPTSTIHLAEQKELQREIFKQLEAKS